MATVAVAHWILFAAWHMRATGQTYADQKARLVGLRHLARQMPATHLGAIIRGSPGVHPGDAVLRPSR